VADAFRQKFDPAIWQVVTQISPGSVLSYGQVAALAGFPRHARMVSKAMGRSPEALPWHRVVSANNRLAFDQGSESYIEQASLLKQEGITFKDGRLQVQDQTESDRESLDRMLWGPLKD